MKAKELMIGDWVRCKKGYPEEDYILQVTDIYGELFNCIIWYGYEIKDGYEFKDCSPIPLTAEILEKNGFIESEVDAGLRYAYERNDGSYVIVYWQDSFDNGCGGELHQGWDEEWRIRVFNNGYYESNPRKKLYVHELQHALRLCGLDDLANSIKL